MIVVVMGVCGTGKSTVGTCLAEKLGWTFADADDFHTAKNKAKMSSGQPLSDQDRCPWLLSIHNYMKRMLQNNQSGVVTCSALKKVYRDVLRHGDSSVLLKTDNLVNTNNSETLYTIPYESSEVNNRNSDTENIENEDYELLGLHFVHLTSSKEIIEKRLASRLGHFMPPLLLQSQLDTLETLDEGEKGITLDIDKSVETIVKEIINRLNIF